MFYFAITEATVESFADIATFIESAIQESMRHDGIHAIPISISYTAGPNFKPITEPTDVAMTFSCDGDETFVCTLVRDDQAGMFDDDDDSAVVVGKYVVI